MRNRGGGEGDPRHHEERDRAEQGAQAPERDPVGVHRPDRPPFVDLDEGTCRRCLDESEAEERESRPDHDREEREHACALARDDAEEVDELQHEPLQDRGRDRDRDQDQAEAEEQPGRCAYMRADVEMI